MSRLTDLIRQARRADEQLGKDLEAEFAGLMKRRTFGLVFEQHRPEAVELPQRHIRRGDKVRVLSPRGHTKPEEQTLWRVTRIERADGQRVAHLTELGFEEPKSRMVMVDDLVVTAEFRDRIYPGLVETGRVERGGDKPFHTVINAENYHALEMLTYTHRHSIDAIYIDPPYNTGARDWKYSNNYVESGDDYRHSKWLAMMERRLKVARELLNPNESVLIVTIDEKEYARLALLLEQTFPEARIQMVTSAVNPMGSRRSGEFSRVDEYIYFVMIGRARVPDSTSNMMTEVASSEPRNVRWTPLNRDGNGWERSARPNMFYPLHVNIQTLRIEKVGKPLALNESRSSVRPLPGCQLVWPLKGVQEARWQIGADTLRALYRDGWVTINGLSPERESGTIRYLTSGARNKITSGVYVVAGTRGDGSKIVKTTEASLQRPRSMWTLPSHSARDHGTSLLSALLGSRKFPFPKSIYAVEDALRFFIDDKPDAIVLDFFSGSGTTAHAVMRLNRQDGGQRQSISVTNNEVSAEEQKTLQKQGLRPGDDDWESLGICNHITGPRIKAAITGRTPAGDPIKGSYRFVDEFLMADGFEENATFLTLTYEAPLSVRHHRAFERIAPMLWMRAGSRGRMITDLGERGWDVADTYGVLDDLDQARDFVRRFTGVKSVQTAFVVTDDDSSFQVICRDLPAHAVPVRLYESYLQNFAINTGRAR